MSLNRKQHRKLYMKKYRKLKYAKLRLDNIEWRKKHAKRCKEYGQNGTLRYRYSINLIDYLNMMKAQKNLCAICKKAETRSIKGKVLRLSVDHWHKENRVRGLLCHLCNTGIGNFRDNPKLLISASKYLGRYM